MKTVLAVCAVLAAAASIQATENEVARPASWLLNAQAEQLPETPTPFRDVPGPPKKKEGGIDEFIYNGGVATRTQFPYQAALFIDLGTFCGGSLISAQWVLTAAHCVSGGTTWFVFLGVTESLSPRQEGRQTFVTRGGKYHPEYNSRLSINDVGLILLPRRAEMTEYVGTVKLTRPYKQYIGSMATVSGFGKISDVTASPISNKLMYTSLPVISNDICAQHYTAEVGNDPSVICLQAEGHSSCKGDSGGPLTLVDGANGLVQIGAVSFGSSKGCSWGLPVGYTNIAHFIDWIEGETGIKSS